MFYPFLCGALHHQGGDDDDDDIFWVNPVSTPRRTRRRRKDSKNPYSTRGLDQFSALLAELEQKRQQIYSQTGPQGIVRFVYKNSNDCVPVVIKLKDNHKKELEKNKLPVNTKDGEHVSEAVQDKLQRTQSHESDKKLIEKKKKKKSFSWKNVKCSSQNWRSPCCCVPATIILILLFLVFFGRSVAILCICISWYIVPAISGEGSDQFRTSMKKKDYVRKLSRTKMVSGKLLYSYKSNKF